MKTPIEIIKAWQEDGDLNISAGSAHVITQLMREYHGQFEEPWQSIDAIGEMHHGKDILLIAREDMPLRPDAKLLHLGKYQHDIQYVTVGHSNYPLTRFKLFMLTDHLLPC